MSRIFSTDRPARDSIGHKLSIRARIDATNYLVTTGGQTQLGYFPGPILLEVGELVLGWWSNEANLFLIRGPFSPQNPTSPATQQSASSTPAAGGAA